MKFYVAPRKFQKVKQLVVKILKEVRNVRRWVTSKAMRSFCGVCVWLTLAMPWARFYSRSIYWDLGSLVEDERCEETLTHQSVRDVGFWDKLSREELDERCIRPFSPTGSLHTDAEDVGYGGTLKTPDMRVGVPG